MKTPLIAVTGATGRIGSLVVEQLRARGVPVRAMVHRPDARSDRLAALGAEVVPGNLFDPREVQGALRGARRLVFIGPWHPHLVDAAAIIATEAPRAGLEAIVSLTQWLANPEHPAISSRQSWLAERLFSQLPVARVTVNPGFYASNYLMVMPLAAQLGVFPWPMGGSANPAPSDEDIARVLVGAVLSPDVHAGRVYRPTGPRLLSGDDIAAAFTEALGRRVRHVDLPADLMLKAVAVQGRRLGLDPFMQAQFRSFIDDSATGVWAVGGVTSAVRDVAGSAPEDFVVVARRAAAHPSNQRTLRNLALALWDMARVPLAAGVDRQAVARRERHPHVERPVLSGDSALWSAEHPSRALTVVSERAS
jgi:uncharacterized protein YbjT (DUF2867 family)